MSQISRGFFGMFDVNIEKQCTFSLEKNLLEVLTLDLKQGAVVERHGTR